MLANNVALQKHSLRALRKLLIAFRSAVRMGDSEEDSSRPTKSPALQYRIDSTALHSKLTSTALRFTPVVLSAQVPLKVLPSGKIKPPKITPKIKALLKLVLGHFYIVLQLLDQNADEETQTLALKESGKLLPYIEAGGSNKKAMKTFIKVHSFPCLCLIECLIGTVDMSRTLVECFRLRQDIEFSCIERGGTNYGSRGADHGPSHQGE